MAAATAAATAAAAAAVSAAAPASSAAVAAAVATAAAAATGIHDLCCCHPLHQLIVAMYGHLRCQLDFVLFTL